MEGWKKDKLGNLLELVYGKSLPKNKRADGNIPVYGSNGIVGFHDKAIVNEPGIIVGRKGSAGNIHISEVPFCPIDTTFYITQQYSKLELDYLYYALNFLDLKRILGDVGVPGLNRKMAYLEELVYPSDKDEQRKIAHILSTVQKAIKQQDKLIHTTTELKKALMQKLFTEGTKGKSQKETEIGLVPESWEVVEFEKLVTIKGGFAFKSKEKVPYSNTQLIRMGNLYQNNLDLNRSPIYYPDCFKNQYSDFVLKEGDLIMSLTGTMGKEDYGFTVKLPKTDKVLLLNQRVAKFVIKTDDIIKDYLKYYLLSRIFLDKLYKTAKGENSHLKLTPFSH